MVRDIFLKLQAFMIKSQTSLFYWEAWKSFGLRGGHPLIAERMNGYKDRNEEMTSNG